jgi:hypothetical protein
MQQHQGQVMNARHPSVAVVPPDGISFPGSAALSRYLDEQADAMQSSRPELASAELAYGCVDWFMYAPGEMSAALGFVHQPPPVATYRR